MPIFAPISLTPSRRATLAALAPADIGIDSKRNRLAVPLFLDNRVETFELR